MLVTFEALLLHLNLPLSVLKVKIRALDAAPRCKLRNLCLDPRTLVWEHSKLFTQQ